MKKALIVIDIQTCYLKQKKQQDHVDRLIKVVNDTLSVAREKEIPILFVEHEFQGWPIRWIMKTFMNGLGLRESNDFSTDSRVNKGNDDTIIKSTGDSFQNADILRWVSEKKVEEVIIIGQDGMYCIKSSINGALKNNFKVSLIDGGVIAQNHKGWTKLQDNLIACGSVQQVDSNLE